jgi:hypothetical protein
MITQAQIEAAAKALVRCSEQAGFNATPQDMAKAALTAAAQVGTFEAGPDECDTGVALTKAIDAVLAEDAPLVNHTIERCAQVADTMVAEVAAAIRKLKHHEPGADRPSREDVEQRL